MTIEPRRPSGMRDYLPQDMIPRQRMLDIIRVVFELYGFVPLDTPGIELEETLTGGDQNFSKQIFRTYVSDSESSKLALRFDLTVPLARVIAEYGSQIEKPFKRYHMGKVWRGERPQAGRFREFLQFDADIVGSDRKESDAEIISIMYDTLSALGFENFVVKVNSRKILNGLASYAGFTEERTPDVLRIIDKMDKIGWEGVEQELRADLGLGVEVTNAVKKFLDLMSVDGDVLERVRSLMSNSPVALEGVSDLAEVRRHVDSLGVPNDKWMIDLSVARGLGYYTGVVFEAVLTDMPEIGSVFSGGRYDDLVSRFGNANFPAVGASVGVDRIFAAMEKLGTVSREKTTSKVILLNFDPECSEVIQYLSGNLRRAGISAEVYLGKELTFKAQLAYAVKQEYPVVVIVGSRERESGTAMVKDTRTRDQEQVPVDAVPDTVKRILGA